MQPQAPITSAPQLENPSCPQATSDGQAWMHTRLNGLSPEDFNPKNPKGIVMFTAGRLQPPPGFEDVWNTLDEDQSPMTNPKTQHQSLQNLAMNPKTGRSDIGTTCVLIFANLADVTEVLILQKALFDYSDSMFADSADSYPIMVLVPHSVGPGFRSQVNVNEQFHLLAQLLDEGIDQAVVGEPVGMKLAIEVQTRWAQESCFTRTALARGSNPPPSAQIIAQHERVNELKLCIDEILWNYARRRLWMLIPAIDENIQPGEPTHIDSFEFRDVLGKGTSGKVFRINDEGEHPATATQAMKMISKTGFDLHGLITLNREIKTLHILSSKCHKHPNIAKLYDVYHSGTHVFLRMECGGLSNLQQRLNSRDATGEQHCQVSQSQVCSIISQCLVAVAHLQTGPKIVHRDLKPANIALSETGDKITIKLVDFGFAHIATENPMCHRVCGTLAFMAPEIVLQDGYNGFHADVWSLGVVLLEALCHTYFVERRFFQQVRMRTKMALMSALRQRFKTRGSVKDLLMKHLRTEYLGLMTPSVAVLGGMLNVVAKDRWSAEELDGCWSVGLASRKRKPPEA